MGTAPEVSEVETCSWIPRRPGGRESLSKALEELLGAGKEGGMESPAARVGVGVR